MASRLITIAGPCPPPYGGISVHVMRSERYLQRAGWSVDLVAAGRVDPALEGVPFIGNSLSRHFRAGLSARGDLLHVHDRISVLTFLLVAGARMRRRKVVVTVHGVPVGLLRKKPRIDRFLEAAVRISNATIAVNGHVEEMLRFACRDVHVIPAYLPPSREEVQQIPESVDRWLRETADMGPLVALLVYRLLPPLAGGVDLYGLQDTVRAITLLAKEGQRLRLAIMLAQPASGPSEIERLRNCEAELKSAQGVASRVFVGEYAPPLIARSALFLRPTTVDGDAVSVREALDLGVPVLASDCVRRPDGAVLYPAGDVAALAAGVRSMLKAPVRVPSRLPDNGAELVQVYERVLRPA